ncbi:desert hedgehog protein [Sardina pilchardus]|uniref:desert hedgehog protein n=1 Tax=Sardina pilchardus TaxID=27697 RepID=UPI002E1538ED
MPAGVLRCQVTPMTLSPWHRRALLVLLSVCTSASLLVHGCGPGPGYGPRPRPRKLIPLRYKQFVPPISENNLGASGRPEGKITRASERFNELVCNYNIHIDFKDEEHTQADRFMTKRCKDCLDRLALAVMLQWPKTRLRVTEAWDEDGNHPFDSLHYEGRAVDITTSDRNTSKYGLLAQLAVEAGFDWVHYESKHHVHCSVKADHSVALERGGCFPGSATVTVEGGEQMPMFLLKPGDKVLSQTELGQTVFSRILLFLHKDCESRSLFLVLGTEDGQRLTLTPNHLLFHSSYYEADHSKYQACFASRVQKGDYLLIHGSGGRVRPSKVTSLTVEERTGIYAPLTEEGTLFVDGVLASSYASMEDHRLAHWAFGLMRFLLSLPQWTQDVEQESKQVRVAVATHTGPHIYDDAQKIGHTRGNGTLKVKGVGWYQNNHCQQNTLSLKNSYGETCENYRPKQGKVHWYARLLHTLGQILLDPQIFY